MDPLLLVVDDEAAVREYLTRCGYGCGFRVVGCEDGREALEFLEKQSADMALVDLCLPEIGGLDLLRAIRRKDPGCEVVMISGAGTISDAVEAIKLGARDYLQKPFQLQTLHSVLSDVRDGIDRRRTVLALERQLVQEFEFRGMMGRSAIMQELFAMVRRLAPHVKTALITGESGTGKELIATALHQLGPRSEYEFVAFDCSGASDLTAAFEMAARGMLFLDQVAALPPDDQTRMLRALEHGVDIAVIAATTRDLRTETKAGRFSKELYYRLSAVELHAPALREHKEDIPYLASAFIRDFSERTGATVAGLTAPAEAFLRRRDWPGNVRELRNTIEQACVLSEGEFLNERDLIQALHGAAPS